MVLSFAFVQFSLQCKHAGKARVKNVESEMFLDIDGLTVVFIRL
jgi:hypothetical protein